jgi:hypothetical protein
MQPRDAMPPVSASASLVPHNLGGFRKLACITIDDKVLFFAFVDKRGQGLLLSTCCKLPAREACHLLLVIGDTESPYSICMLQQIFLRTLYAN